MTRSPPKVGLKKFLNWIEMWKFPNWILDNHGQQKCILSLKFKKPHQVSLNKLSLFMLNADELLESHSLTRGWRWCSSAAAAKWSRRDATTETSGLRWTGDLLRKTVEERRRHPVKVDADDDLETGDNGGGWGKQSVIADGHRVRNDPRDGSLAPWHIWHIILLCGEGMHLKNEYTWLKHYCNDDRKHINKTIDCFNLTSHSEHELIYLMSDGPGGSP